MFTYNKTYEISDSINFTEDEIKGLIKYYKRDCEKWHLDPNDCSNFKIFMEWEYLRDLNNYKVDSSTSNIYDLYNSIQKFL